MDNLFFKIDEKIKRQCYCGLGIGLVAFIAAYLFFPERFWTSLLINNFYFLTIGLSGVFFLALQFVTNSSWMRPYQRIPQAMMSFLPWVFASMLLIYFGIHSLYEWSHVDVVEHDEILKQKAVYLNAPFFMIRMAVFFGGWIVFSQLLSKGMDNIDPKTSKLTKYSALFLLFFALTFSFGSYDWIMSLEPHWFSTIFSIYTFSGMFVSGIAFITLSLIVLNRLGYLNTIISKDHYHDLGKWLMGMSTFWAYIWFSQYMLIWYSNIPEETQYFILRNNSSWNFLFWVNLFVNWVIPFLILLPRGSKRNTLVLSGVCVLLLVGHWLDLYLLVAPKIFQEKNLTPYVGLIETLTAFGFASLFVLIFMHALKKRELVQVNDPYYEEGLHLHQ